MKETTFNKTQVIKYLIWTFGIAYLIQAGVGVLSTTGLGFLAQPVMALMMFVPLLGTVLAGGNIKTIGWKPRFRGNVRLFLLAWFSPALLTAVGAALYFLVFPAHFDLSGAYLNAAAGTDVIAQMEAQGITYPVYILIGIASALAYAPAINMVFALGEEVGWRGFLYPQLRAKFGARVGRLIGGVIWGSWHFPLIWLIGYEYGYGYFGFPVAGMLLFCFITVALGIIFDWVYEKSGVIWLPALFHGSFNAAATLPLMVTVQNTGSARLLGSAPVGMLAGLPLMVFAAVLFLKSGRRAGTE